ncbi:ROK family protein [Cetobacterium ceti]|uniref:ROK family protein n=1 Tax=Cetobacterium ceti TaxID=180163 RepID=A0A1T4P7Q2_9FUSO|nr:ROK family protein [Cetobacterium ceti]
MKLVKLVIFHIIIQKANNGDSYFRTLLFDLSKAISHGILWTEYLLNPEAIIITGKITAAHDLFWQEVRRTLNNNLLNKHKHIELFLSKYDENSILEGALYLGLEYFFDI